MRHDVNTLTWVVKGQNGKTAYQRVRGIFFRTRLTTFGEKCRYKMRSQEPFGASGDGRRFHIGNNVGVDPRTGQYMIHRGDGIVYARTAIWFPEPNTWNKNEMAKRRATPWSLHVLNDTEIVFKDKKEVDKTDIPGKIVVARQPFSRRATLPNMGSREDAPSAITRYHLSQGARASFIRRHARPGLLLRLSRRLRVKFV